MRTALLAGLLWCLAVCVPAPAQAQVTINLGFGPGPWYSQCSWDAPCWYGDNQVFVYGWGYVDRPTYVFLHDHPGKREGWAHRRRDWHPGPKPSYRGRDWDGYKARRDKEHDDHDHHDDHDNHDNHDNH